MLIRWGHSGVDFFGRRVMDTNGQNGRILGQDLAVRECQGAVAPAPDGTQLALRTYTLIYDTPASISCSHHMTAGLNIPIGALLI
ncbi:hypothetical protein Zmor_004894 [Zophobas morio]|uniref:Uncharacterized protein n=1 Tax=Zophobas morio TaxID=2755281 RepID=A0AA38IRA7_9CUCU|nr:hypothetical protein Zmor_004894 [Zophobas morio]